MTRHVTHDAKIAWIGFIAALIMTVSLIGQQTVQVSALAVTTTRVPSPTRISSQAAATAVSSPTLTPTEATIASVEDEVLFPMLIRFRITMRLKVSDIKAAQIHITDAEVLDQTIDVPLKDGLKPLNDTASEIYYLWPLNAQNSPMPFSTVVYTWTVQTNAGDKYSQGNSLVYSDVYKKWKNTEQDTLKLYSHNQGLAIDLVQSNVFRAQTLIGQDTGITHPLTAIIYDAGSEPCQPDVTHGGKMVLVAQVDQTVFTCDPAQAAKVYAARGFTFVQRTTPSLEALEDQLVGVIATDAYDTLWKDAAEAPPAWFRAGMTQWYGVIGHAYALLLARDAARNDQVLSLDALNVPPVPNAKDNGASVRTWNAQSYMLTLYIAERFGANAPVSIAKQIGQKGKFADALAAVGSGETLPALYTDWQNWLFSPDADRALLWNPYITTATATLTLTETEYPTSTALPPTPTETETPTDIVPTATAIPASPTPLPPGSLKTATPAK